MIRAVKVRVGSLQPDPRVLHLELVPGVFIDISPISYFEMLVYQETAQRLIDDLRAGVDACREAGIVLKENFDIENPVHVNALYRESLTKEIAAHKIVAWQGFEDEETGEPLPVTPELARSIMNFHEIAMAFFEKASAAHVAMTFAKKESGTASNGLAAAVPNTAKAAPSTKPPAARENGASTGSSARKSKTRRRPSRKSRPSTRSPSPDMKTSET